MAQIFESSGQLVINGDRVFDVQSATVRLDAQANDVPTDQGWGGVSLGPGFTQIDVTKAVPKDGATASLVDFARQFVNVQYFTGGKVYELTMFVFFAQTQGGVTQSAQESAMLKGAYTVPRAA